MCLVEILEHICSTGYKTQELVWTVLFLIPEETTNTRGIGLLETLGKVVEALIDTRLCASLQLHDVFHGFSSGRGMGTAIMELKLAQDIASIDQYSHFLVFLDQGKSYDTAY